MNATEHLVEQYFRLCHNCLTVSDIKVKKGNNRQLDLLAYQPIKRICLHVEVSVTHSFKITFAELMTRVDQKYFGVATKRSDNPQSDAAKQKNYLEQIESVYQRYGTTRDTVLRVFCIWRYEHDQVAAWQAQLQAKYGDIAADRFRLLSFRDEVLPRLEHEVGTAHYDDELARLLSLQKARRSQLELPGTPVDINSPFRFSF